MAQNPAEMLLSVDRLAAAYWSKGGLVPVLRGVSLEIRPGEVVGLLGESGCGKTTAALAILGLLPTGATVQGTARFRGVELVGQSEDKLRRIRGSQISLILQEPALSLNPVIRVVDQVAEVARAHFSLSRDDCRKRACAALDEVGLNSEDLRGAYPHELSGGQQQRVVIAQATVCRPSLLIADEPTRSLDEQTRQEVLALLIGMVRELNASLLLVTHDPRILAAIADRIMVMYAGRIVEAGAASDVLQSPLHPYTRALLRCLIESAGTHERPNDRHIPAIIGSPPDFQRLPAGCPFEPRCVERLTRCSQQEPAIASVGSRQVGCFLYGQAN